jgi:hypothetical protein
MSFSPSSSHRINQQDTMSYNLSSDNVGVYNDNYNNYNNTV